MAARMVRVCGGEPAVRKGPWTLEEDLILVSYISEHGEGAWDNLARAAGLNRNGKSCRLRWLNYLRPGVRRGSITPAEDAVIRELQATLGNKWSKIAKYLPGRTDNEIKNYWRTRIQKRPPGTTAQQQQTRRLQPTTVTAAFSEGASSSSGSASHDGSAAAGDCWFMQLETEQQAYYRREAPVAAPTGMVKSERASSALASQDCSAAAGDCWFMQLKTEQQAYYCQDAPVAAPTGMVKSESASSALATSQDSSTAGDCWYTQASYPYYPYGLSSAADHLGMVDVDATTTTQFFSSEITDSFWSAVNNLWETIPVKGAF